MKWLIMFCASFLPLVMCAPAAHSQASANHSTGGYKVSAARQAMIAACTNKSAGAPCSLSREGQTVNGTCKADPVAALAMGESGKQLTCFSSERPQGRKGLRPLSRPTPGANVPQQ
jgi:hypothetical protein